MARAYLSISLNHSDTLRSHTPTFYICKLLIPHAYLYRRVTHIILSTQICQLAGLSLVLLTNMKHAF
jgi:hypothetical protein